MSEEMFNEELGRRAFEAVMADIQSAGGPTARLNADLQAAAKRALEAARFLRQAQDASGASLEARLLEFPKWALDPNHVLLLERKAWACWYVNEQRIKASVSERGAPLSQAEVAAAKERRARMLALVSHHLGTDRGVQKELADIRKGAGYEDLALDLSRLAALYDLHAAKLSTDPTWWRAQDAAEARREAVKLTERVAHAKAPEWSAQAGRCLASLRASYARVRDAARFAWPDRTNLYDRFPPL